MQVLDTSPIVTSHKLEIVDSLIPVSFLSPYFFLPWILNPDLPAIACNANWMTTIKGQRSQKALRVVDTAWHQRGEVAGLSSSALNWEWRRRRGCCWLRVSVCSFAFWTFSTLGLGIFLACFLVCLCELFHFVFMADGEGEQFFLCCLARVPCWACDETHIFAGRKGGMGKWKFWKHCPLRGNRPFLLAIYLSTSNLLSAERNKEITVHFVCLCLCV